MQLRRAEAFDGVFVHELATVEDGAVLGSGTKIWAHAQIRTGARLGVESVIGRNVFVDVGVVVGDRCKIQNNALLYEGVRLEGGVFVGPAVVFTNDRIPRAVTPDGRLKTAEDWELGTTIVRFGAAVGASAVVVTGVEIGPWALVGSGAVVTRDVPAHALVVGNPGRIIAYVSAGGDRFETQAAAVAATAAERGQ